MFFIRAIFCFSALLPWSFSASAEKVSCPPGLSWTFEGYCMKPIDSKGSACPPGTTLTKINVTGPMICKGRWKCLSDIDKVPNSQGQCVDPSEVKSIPRQYTQKMVHTAPKPETTKTE
jgi:hypothetical protein